MNTFKGGQSCVLKRWLECESDMCHWPHRIRYGRCGGVR
jgi:hypothetical protein